MSKYIHESLDHFLILDSKFIKMINPDLKKSEILNSLAQILGWRHYNELKKNVKKGNIDKFTNISKLKYKELRDLKTKYFNELYERYPIEREHDFYDPYQIKKGRIFNIVNLDAIVFDQEKQDALRITIDLSDSKSFIKLNNEEMELLIEVLFDRMDNDDISSSMWRGRQKTFIDALFMALKNDVRNLDFQKELIELLNLNSLLDYVKSYLDVKGNEKKYIVGLNNYILHLPGFKDYKSEINQVTLEQHGYIAMQFYMLNKSFFSRDPWNTRTYSLSELVNHNGSIRFIYNDERDNLMDIKTLYKVIQILRGDL